MYPPPEQVGEGQQACAGEVRGEGRAALERPSVGEHNPAGLSRTGSELEADPGHRLGVSELNGHA
jgi:hypothetical protein